MRFNYPVKQVCSSKYSSLQEYAYLMMSLTPSSSDVMAMSRLQERVVLLGKKCPTLDCLQRFLFLGMKRVASVLFYARVLSAPSTRQRELRCWHEPIPSSLMLVVRVVQRTDAHARPSCSPATIHPIMQGGRCTCHEGISLTDVMWLGRCVTLEPVVIHCRLCN